MLITFTLRLLDPPTSPFVVVAGGADGDRDGTIEDNGEVGIFDRVSNRAWNRTQEVQVPTIDMIFGVSFTVGTGVRWELVIKDAGATILYSGGSTTLFASETVAFRFGA
jgi:hypothetical protein